MLFSSQTNIKKKQTKAPLLDFTGSMLEGGDDDKAAQIDTGSKAVDADEVSSVKSETPQKKERAVPQPLDTAQIKEAEEQLFEMHPLSNTAFKIAYPQIWPALKYGSACAKMCGACCSRCCQSKSKDKNNVLTPSNLNAQVEMDEALKGIKQGIVSKVDLSKQKLDKLNQIEKTKEAIKKKTSVAGANRDPFVTLGFGLFQYRNLLESLYVGFAFMAMITLPCVYMFLNGDGYNKITAGRYGYLSLGNLGYSSVQCSIIPFNFDKIGLNCPYGEFGEIVVDGVGINEAKLNKKSFCQVTKEEHLIHWANLRNLNYEDRNDECSKLIDDVKLRQAFKTQCADAPTDKGKGNKICTLTVKQIRSFIKKDNEELYKRCTSDDSFFFLQHTCIQDKEQLRDKWIHVSISSFVCMITAVIFIMIVLSEQSLTQLRSIKYDVQSVTASDFTVILDISKQDYEQFEKNEYDPKGRLDDKSPAMYLKEYLKFKIEAILNRSYNMKQARKSQEAEEREKQREQEALIAAGGPDAELEAVTTNGAPTVNILQVVKGTKKGKAMQEKKSIMEYEKRIRKRQEQVFNPEFESNMIKVADIKFAFENHEIISLLKERGTAIKKLEWEDLEEIDKKIQDYISDADHRDKLMRPVCAFITFEREIGHEEALDLTEQIFTKKSWIKDLRETEKLSAKERRDAMKDSLENSRVLETIFNRVPKFIQACDPSNVIWENRHVKEKQFRRNFWKSVLIMMSAIAFFFVLILSVKIESMAFTMKYAATDCPTVDQVFGTDDEQYLQSAYLEYQIIDRFQKTKKEEQSELPAVGTKQCFCESQAAKKKVKDTYLLDGKEIDLCQEYLKSKFKNSLMSQAMAYVIIAINLVLNQITLKVVRNMGCQTESQELMYITMYSFVSQILNTGFLLLLANCNIAEQSIPIISRLLSAGPDPDFGSRWFKSVGDTMVQTQIINIVLPFGTATAMYCVRKFKRLVDSGCCKKDAPPTKQLTLQTYIDLYAGPEFNMSLKYSQIMVSVFIALTFGVGMPILYLIACIQLCGIYTLEKGMLYYSYKKPSSYDEVLNTAVLKVLMLAPIFQLSFGYWFLSNKQLLSNDYLRPKLDSTQPYDSRHYIAEALNPTTSFHPADMVQSALYVYLVFYVARNVEFVMNFLLKFPLFRWFGNLDFDINVKENLDMYWKCLDEDDREYSIEEESNNNSCLNLRTMLDYSRKQLIANKTGRMSLQNLHCYDILRDPQYYQAFQYVAANTPGRAQIIKDGEEYGPDDGMTSEYQSDLVRLVLSLAYLNDKQLHDFKFSKEYVRDLYEKSGAMEKRERARSAAESSQGQLEDAETDGEDDLTTIKGTDREYDVSMVGGKSFFNASINADKRE